MSRRQDLVRDQTRRIGRLRDLLCSIHPGLERVTDPTNKAELALLARYVTPAEIRHAGKARITAHLRRTAPTQDEHAGHPRQRRPGRRAPADHHRPRRGNRSDDRQKPRR